MDARNGMLATRGWTEQTSVSAVKLAEKISDWPLAAIVYTDIACDGMLSGPNLEQVEVVANSTAVPVIASGGVASIEDVKNLCRLSLAGIIIGRALYEGKLDLAEAIKIVRR
jgi:phosphoribosylformimino-5-aminoimidazole carboxamide ribotide isomerase